MGNCGRKMKKEFNSWYYHRRTGTVRIGSPMQCPKCGMNFHGNTTYNTVNNHLDNCLATQESSANNNPAPVISSMQANQINSILANQTQHIGNGPFVWIKKTGPDNTVTWEKVSAGKTKTDDHLTNMSAKTAKELSFEDKQKWFKLQIEKYRIPWTYGADVLEVSEKNLAHSALTSIKKVNMHKEVKIAFEEEKKVHDAGGLLREFIHLLCLELFKPERGLFVKADTDEVIYSINPRAPNSKENLDCYKLLGRIFGKAIFEQMTIPVQLDRLLLKQIISEEFTLEDLTTVDKPLYNSLKYIKENPIDDEDVFEEYFVVDDPLTGDSVELIPNGTLTLITDENKEEYIKLKLAWLGKTSIEKKLTAFLDGLFMVLPKEQFHVFTLEEIEMILNGLPFIDVHDWEHNTVYKGSYYKGHQVIKWFWQVMRELNQEQLTKFYHFCTGSTRLPVEGFRALQSNRGETCKFNIESAKYTKETAGLIAHTCFNRLQMPMYPSKELVKEHIHSILRIDFNGVFGIE